MGTLRIDHDFSPNVQLQNTTRYGKTKQDYLLTAFMGSTANLKTTGVPTDPSTWTLARSLRTVKDQENTILTNQTVVSAQFDTGVLKHSVVAGAEFTSEKQTNYSYVPASLGTLPDANLYHPNPRDTVTGHKPVRSGAFTEGEVNTQSLYVFDTVKFGDKWIFNGGVRFDHFNTTYDAVTLQTAVDRASSTAIASGHADSCSHHPERHLRQRQDLGHVQADAGQQRVRLAGHVEGAAWHQLRAEHAAPAARKTRTMTRRKPSPRKSAPSGTS